MSLLLNRAVFSGGGRYSPLPSQKDARTTKPSPCQIRRVHEVRGYVAFMGTRTNTRTQRTIDGEVRTSIFRMNPCILFVKCACKKRLLECADENYLGLRAPPLNTIHLGQTLSCTWRGICKGSWTMPVCKSQAIGPSYAYV